MNPSFSLRTHEDAKIKASENTKIIDGAAGESRLTHSRCSWTCRILIRIAAGINFHLMI
jgi:hypothetical protein